MRISDWSSDVCSSDLRDDSPLDAVDETGEIAELGRRRRQLRPTRQSQRLALVEALDLGERVDLGLDQVGDAREHRRPLDRKSVVSGKSVSVRVDIGCRRFIKKKK